MNKSAVCQLHKSLYGLKKTPRAWNSKITHQLCKMGFEVSKFDSLMFIQKVQKGPVCILLYVLIISADLAEISQVKSKLSTAFEKKDLGDLHYSLGV